MRSWENARVSTCRARAVTLAPRASPDDYEHDLWAVGADLEPGTILSGYRVGLFPMPVQQDESSDETVIGWWSPLRRGVIPLDRRPPRALRRVAGRYEIRVDTTFEVVMTACGDPSRPHGWIDDSMLGAYLRLHALGWVHSVECWDEHGLAGGLYGVSVGGLFAAESMFQHRPDAAKCALLALVTLLQDAADSSRRVLDVQWCTPHLALLGASEITRAEYRIRLADAAGLREPVALSGGARVRLTSEPGQESRVMSFESPMKKSNTTRPIPMTETRS